MNTSEPNPSESDKTANDHPKRSRLKRFLLGWPLAILVGVAIFFIGQMLIDSYCHESTDDAYIDANIVSISPQISGKVLAVHVLDNQLVQKGASLLDIDPADYRAKVAQQQAALESAIAKQMNAKATLAQAKAHILTLQAAAGSMIASVNAAAASNNSSQSDLVRDKDLVEKKVISASDFIHARDTAASAAATLVSKQKQLESTEAYLKEAELQIDVDQAQIQAADAAIGQARAELKAAQLQLGYTHLVAPEDGLVTKKNVVPGNYVTAGQALMAIVPQDTPRDVWVTANFKETQLAHLHRGMKVVIHVDAYPDHAFRGHIDSIQAGSGAQFSLLPPENATGNFVKIVQRVPVKILFDEKPDTNHILGPGMSVEPSIRIRSLLSETAEKIVLLILGVIAALFVGIHFTRNKNR